MHRRFALAGILAGVLVTAPAAANTCVFVVSMVTGSEVNNLDLVVNYAGADGNVEGTPSNPQCVRALPGQSFASFRDDDAARRLRSSIIRLAKFSAPVPLFGCRFFYDTVQPDADDFLISVSNAGRDGEDDNVVPRPVLAVTSVECPGTLPEVTTTTLVDITTTTLVSNGSCGVPVSGGLKPSASDALFALRASVGTGICPLCECDINNSGSVTASDAAGILRAAVGGNASLNCPPC